MTTAKAPHRAARTLLLRHLDLNPGVTRHNDLDPAEVGIVGDTAHAAGGDSYHLGQDQIRARNGNDRYSVDESSRDKNGLDNNASAVDVGYFKVTTPRGTFDLYDFNRWLVRLCEDGDPDTRDLREVINSLDGKTVRRWDRLRRRTSGGSDHTWHTHLSEFRDASGTRMVRIATRWLQHIGLLPDGDDMPTVEDILSAKVKVGDESWRLDTAIGYSARKSYEAVRDLAAFATAEATRDAQQAATLAAVKTAVTGLAAASGAMTPAQVESLMAQVRDVAAEAGAAATAAVTARIDSLRAHLGDNDPA